MALRGLIFEWVLSMSKDSFIGVWRGWRWPGRFPIRMQKYDGGIAVYE